MHHLPSYYVVWHIEYNSWFWIIFVFVSKTTRSNKPCFFCNLEDDIYLMTVAPTMLFYHKSILTFSWVHTDRKERHTRGIWGAANPLTGSVSFFFFFFYFRFFLYNRGWPLVPWYSLLHAWGVVTLKLAQTFARNDNTTTCCYSTCKSFPKWILPRPIFTKRVSQAFIHACFLQKAKKKEFLVYR